jgi:catechol 2,3-dioxygenase-like lactoylglutathione lyase family enzyme
MPTDGLGLFAGMRVSDLERARAWYEQLLGQPPAFAPNDSEWVWELADNRFLYIEKSDGAGHGLQTLFLDDFDDRVSAISSRGLEPASAETYSNGVRKWTYRDPDGNEVGLGGAPVG